MFAGGGRSGMIRVSMVAGYLVHNVHVLCVMRCAEAEAFRRALSAVRARVISCW